MFSFDPPLYEVAINSWVRRMPELSGFSQSEFETHVREEYSTFSWVLEGFLERAGLEILEREYPAPEYAEYLCRPPGRPPSNKPLKLPAAGLSHTDDRARHASW